MADKIMKVNLVGVDIEGIKEDPGDPNYALLPFQVSSAPDPRWIEIFKNHYKLDAHTKKKGLKEITSEKIILRLGLDDDPQSQADFLEEMIAVANEEVDRINEQKTAQEKAAQEEEKIRRAKFAQLIEKAAKVKL